MHITIISPKRERFEEGRMEFWEFGFMVEAAGSGGRKFSGTPLSLPILSSLIPEDIAVALIDENVENVDFDIATDLVILTFFTTAATRGYKIAQEFKSKGVPVLIGGCHASMLPEEAIRNADSVAIGEAEVLLPEIIRDFCNGGLQRFYKHEEKDRPALDHLPVPHWNRLKLTSYFNPTIQTMRGCPFMCEFCTVRVHWGSKYRYKPIDDVVNEVKFLKEQFGRNTFFMIVDDDVAADRKRAKELFKALIPHNVQWMSQGSIAMAKDDEYLELMTKSGGTRIIMGLESISKTSIINMKKNPANKYSEYSKDLRKIESYGVGIIGAFVFGFDEDDATCFDNTADFIIDNNIALPQLFALTPFPGTALTRRLEEEGRIISRDWKRYTGSMVLFQPKLMSPQELQNGYYHTIQKVYSYQAIWKRLTGLWNLFRQDTFKSEAAMLKEKIDIILLNKNFRAVAYSYPLNYETDTKEEEHYQKELQGYLKSFLQQRSKLLGDMVPGA